jgi:hypothetical protein
MTYLIRNNNSDPILIRKTTELPQKSAMQTIMYQRLILTRYQTLTVTSSVWCVGLHSHYTLATDRITHVLGKRLLANR